MAGGDSGVRTRNEDRLTERRSQDGGRLEAVDRSAPGRRATNVSEFRVRTPESPPPGMDRCRMPIDSIRYIEYCCDMDIFGAWGDPGDRAWRGGWHGRHKGRRAGWHGRRGILKLALLKLLAETPRHGYDLIRAVRERGWGSGPGSVYPLLGALEAAGLIAGRDEGDRRVYEITDEGRRLLGERAPELERVLNQEDEENDEDAGVTQLRDSALRLVQALRQLGGSAKPETVERVRGLLDGVRKEIYKLLAEE
jgi:DNA-binding PadR family transcriptional regulator